MKPSKIIPFFVLLCISLGTLWYASPFHHSSAAEESENVFASPTYANYQRQLLNFLQGHPLYLSIKHKGTTPFHLQMAQLINSIEQPLGDDAQQQRAYHERWVEELRKTISFTSFQLAENRDVHQFLQDLVQWIFLKVDLHGAFNSFFYSIAPQWQEENFFSYIQDTLRLLKKNPELVSPPNDPSHEDHFLHGNLPSLLFSLPPTNVIRIANPLGDFSRIGIWPWYPLQIHPEFLLFLKTQPSHLYVNLMKRHGEEKYASYTLESLEQAFPKLYVVTLDKDSPFYWQKSLEEPIPSTLFKEQFLTHLFAENSSFFWSSHLDIPSWKQELNHLIQTIHNRYFPSFQTFNREERLDFIELTYLEILNTLVHKWHPASMNITCRYNIDRGPSLSILWMLQKTQTQRPEIASELLAPPLLIDNRPSHSARISRFTSAARRFLEDPERL